MLKHNSVCLIIIFFASVIPAQTPGMIGFFPASMENQAKYESLFLSTPTPEMERKWLHWLTEEPHVAGTDADRRTADYVKDRFTEFGLDAEIVTYEVYINYPKQVSLRMTQPEEQELSLTEKGLFGDKDSYSKDVFPGFHGYGASGKANGQIVYVNYGRPEDFDVLEEDMGISVKGKIALVRYGQLFRGLKVREAQTRGASGVIIYSDPADDGYMKGDIYPNGPMRPETSLQRGSVAFNSEGAGDPTTPGWPSVKNAKRLDAASMRLARIPSVPLSYGEAQKLLKALGGPNVPEGWQGGLPFAYHAGPGAAEVEMNVEMDYAVRPIWNVIGKIAGNEETDRWVILGNHRDAWAYGAVDPNSGTATLIETARGLGAAIKAGWKPRRSILLASWDGEEYGLLGSTEWAEEHAEELKQKAVAYLNCDSAVTGPAFSAEGSASLRDVMMQAAAAVPEPTSGGNLLDAWKKSKWKEWSDETPVELDKPDPEFYLNTNQLGSGSDYTAFLDHLGIASMNFSFDGPYGVYHSIYDDFYWMEHFGDPGFQYHATASKYYGILAMRLAGAEIIPMRYTPFARRLQKDFDDIRRSNRIALRVPPAGAKGKKKPPLAPDFAPVLKALQAFASAAQDLDSELDRGQKSGSGNAAGLLSHNDAMMNIERAFLDPAGLPKRPWFQHVLIAPGYNAGYDAWPFPGINQALEDRDPAMLETEMKRVVQHLNTATSSMRQIRFP